MKVWVVEDEELVRDSIKARLQSIDSELDLVFSESLVEVEAKLASKARGVDLALVDLMSAHDPDGEKSVAILSQLSQRFPAMNIVVQSGADDIALMRKAMAGGIDRFFSKEHLLESLSSIIPWAKEAARVEQQMSRIIVGSCEETRLLRMRLKRVLFESSDVLVEGESGTGKELCAEALAIGRSTRESVNVAAIPAETFEATLFGHEKGAFTGAHQARPGLLESVGDGVLFLDEIQSLSLDLQAKLLRVLQSRKFRRLGSNQERVFNGRIVSASNRSLSRLVDEGLFREDLYFRLNALSVHVPSLRERSEDIPELLGHFLKAHDLKQQWQPDAIEALQGYDWPGNVRQLSACVQSAGVHFPMPKIGREEVEELLKQWEQSALQGGEVRNAEVRNAPASQQDSDFTIDWQQSLDHNVRELEKFMVARLLDEKGPAEAREALGLKKSRFYEKVKTLGIR